VENNKFVAEHTYNNGQSQKRNILNRAKNLCTVYICIGQYMQNPLKKLLVIKKTSSWLPPWLDGQKMLFADCADCK